LDSLAQLAEITPEFETIVVDNASEDGTVEALRNFGSGYEKLRMRVIPNSRNVGLSSATCQAYREAIGEWILLCNPDIVFNKNFIVLLSYGYSHPDQMITAEMVNKDGTPQRVIHRRFPSVTRVFFDFGSVGSYLDEKLLNHRVRKSYCYQDAEFGPVVALESSGASFLLISRRVVEKLGLIFDPVFPVWWNDVDLSKRAEAVGIQRILLSNVKVKHGLGRGSRSALGPTRRFLFCRSMILYARRWRMHPRSMQLLFSADAIIGVFLFAMVQARRQGLFHSLKGSIAHASAQISGVLGG
jgi:GT2 family glycosyltransferase